MPVLHLLAGPNGAGKTTFHRRLLQPATKLPFINADQIAAAMWPGDEERHGYDAARIAAEQRSSAIAERRSFVTETVFSHSSKLDLIETAREAGYLIVLHVVLVPLELSVIRVQLRSAQGGHSVPEEKVRTRYRRLWPLIQAAIERVDEAIAYDNSSASVPFREVARFRAGSAEYEQAWPVWSPLPRRR